MYCSQCGNKLLNGSVFCAFCGYKLDGIAKTTVSQTERVEMPLVEFAKEFGKMQVCKSADKSGNIHVRCIFTKITEVEFGVSVGELTASEISENKQKLIISRTDDGKYELKLKEGASLKNTSELELPPSIDKKS